MWTCSCRAHNWASHKLCHKCGRLSEGRPHRGPSGRGPVAQPTAVPQDQSLQPQGPWYCAICEATNAQGTTLCEQCTYSYDHCRKAEQDARRWMLERYPPPWHCGCGCVNVQSLQRCRKRQGQKPQYFASLPAAVPRRVWRPVSSSSKQLHLLWKPHARASLAGAYPNKAPMIGENDHVPNFEEQCRERQLLPQQGAQTSDNKNENPNGLPKSEQLLAVHQFGRRPPPGHQM